MKKKALIFALVTGLLVFGAVSSQAALMELQVGGVELPATIGPGPGSLVIDLVLTDTDGLASIDGFNLWVGASGIGANSLITDPLGNTLPGFIFPSTLLYFFQNPTPLEVQGFSTTFESGTTGLLAQLTFDYDGNLGEIYNFGLVDASQNFVSMGSGNEFPLDFDVLSNTQIEVVPIPAAVWLLGSGLLALVGLRRKLS